MPSSGARSGTEPSRATRGAGTGTISGPTRLRCGHGTYLQPVATRSRVEYFDCPAGCGIIKAVRG